MIVFREKIYSRLNNTMIQKLSNDLDRDRIDSYDILNKIPEDSVSIGTDLDFLEIYIPEDYEYSQYGIDNIIRKTAPSIRTSTDYEENFIIMKCKGRLTYPQYYKILKSIIEEEGYCVIVQN